MNDDVLIIVCSSPYSRRLKEKCFLKIGGKSVLEHIFGRIKTLNIKTVLAIPNMLELNVDLKYIKESLNNVLYRLRDVASQAIAA